MRLRRCSTSARASGLWKTSLRQRHFDRLALAGLARDADCAQPHRHLCARPRVLGEVDGRMPVADAIRGRRQLQGRLGRRRQRARSGTGTLVGTGEVCPGAGEPKPILRLVGERQRAREVGARLLGRDDRRNASRGDGEDDDRHRLAAAQDRRLAGPVDRPPLFGGTIVRERSRAGGRAVSGPSGARSLAFLFRRGDRAFDARLDNARIAAHHQNGIFRDGQRLRIGGLEIDDQRRLAGIGRRVDPCVDAARRDRGDSLVAPPVESGGEAAVHLGSRDDRRREGQHRHGEAKRVRVPLGHAGRGRGDANGLDFALKPRLMGRPKRLRCPDRHGRWRENRRAKRRDGG